MKTIEIKQSIEIDSEATEQIEYLCENIISNIKGEKIISITSCKNREGKTFISLQTARELARRKNKVLYVFADFRKVMVYGRNVFKGILEILRGEMSLVHGIYQTDITNMDIIFSGEEINDKDNDFSIENVNKLFNSLKESYDYIIVDTPTIGMTLADDIIYTCSDTAILVLKKNNDSRRLINRVIKMIEDRRCSILGVVINEWNEKIKRKKEKKNH